MDFLRLRRTFSRLVSISMENADFRFDTVKCFEFYIENCFEMLTRMYEISELIKILLFRAFGVTIK